MFAHIFFLLLDHGGLLTLVSLVSLALNVAGLSHIALILSFRVFLLRKTLGELCLKRFKRHFGHSGTAFDFLVSPLRLFVFLHF